MCLYNWYMHASSWYEDLACGWEASLALSRTNLHFMTLIPALQCIANSLTFINIRCPSTFWLKPVFLKSSTGKSVTFWTAFSVKAWTWLIEKLI